jgi:hypothetical protein
VSDDAESDPKTLSLRAPPSRPVTECRTQVRNGGVIKEEDIDKWERGWLSRYARHHPRSVGRPLNRRPCFVPDRRLRLSLAPPCPLGTGASAPREPASNVGKRLPILHEHEE